MSTKLLLDTDIGSDIDDAVCLAYLLANPDCELLGITTVTGKTTERARMVSALCNVAECEIPIFPGTEQPLLIEQRQPTAWQSVALEKWPHEKNFPQGEAIRFLRDTIRAHPGEVTLLAIGPMTNVALLFAMDPEIPSLLKGLVMMAGKFFGHTSSKPPCDWCEWNVMLDPHAAAIVYRHSVAVHRSIGMDVTLQVTMPADEVRERFQTPLLRPVLDFAEVWFGHQDKITFHDPLAATTLFDQQICRFEKGTVDVELASPHVSGMTHWQPAPTENSKLSDSPHEIAVDVDVDRFFDRYFSVFDR